ncbi:T7SS effector LXG polymorphic toxin [Listeria fleischmannii]|uniref:T7SS effector LXG polymorphic toxin n=1 Tax=Listeria fleischmannii TaxID=1069827 RepID=UPI001C8AEE0E|nr:T7SS effector LXG polymorphic toxin [Listeria fleischmannii]
MSRIDIGEVRHFLTILKQANAEARVWLLQLKQTVERYVQDDSLSGKAVEASKSYFEASYPPLIETILQAFDTSEALLAQYIQEFHSQVDPSPNARIDAVLLGQAMEKVKSIRRKQEALQQSLSGSTAGLYEGRAQNLRLDFIEAVEQEKILEKYLQFEQSHTHFFEPLVELVQAAKRAVDVLRQQVHFNEETGTYTVAKTFAPAMKSLQDSLQKARGIDPKLDEQLEDYEILAVVYKDNTGKDAVMWVLEKDGVRVQNTKLQKYIEQTGRYQDAEKYTIITLADLDKKITKAWQKGTYYMNGKVYSGGTGKVLQASAYVQEWKGKIDESGLTDVVLGLGLSTAAIRYKDIKVDMMGGKIPINEHAKIVKASLHNVKTDSMMLGKYTPAMENGVANWGKAGPDSYIAKAGNDSMYFDLGQKWSVIETKYKLTPDEMFEQFNVPALDRAVKDGKTIRFSHDPMLDAYKDSYLRKEWNYLKSEHNYKRLKQEGDVWIAVKKK